MPLTRLDNLISSKTGKYLYVSPDDFNATDALSNRGNSPITPFKSIQRAFLEIARFSYLPGFGNDRFDQFSIMLMPGIHYIDNRPGLVDTTGIDEFAFDQVTQAWGADPILDISNPDNVLYKFNNTEGGAIIPRGSSLVGYDLRRTTLRPMYVPDPATTEREIPRSAIFNVTGGCYFWQFTIKDGQTTSESPLYDNSAGTGKVYYDPTDFTKLAAPNFSHHKLTVFEYADKEELSLFYRKIAKAFSNYQPTIDDPGEFDFSVQENRIVGPLSDSRVIESLKFTDATTDSSIPASTSEVEVTTKVDHGYFQGQFVAIANTEIDTVLEGIFQIKEIDQNNPRKFTYEVPVVVSAIGTNLSSGEIVSQPTLGQNAQTLAEVDSVESASPYVFNVSIRSTWGICGIWANGLKATGFKSMVIAQYTGVSLQKDDRAFIRYDEYSNTWNQASLIDAFATVPYHTKGDSYWKDEWRNFHVRASDDAFIQNVSIFAVGFADHFLMESGGDMSITNSNSNFGNTSLHAIGFKGFAFNQDKGGFITDIIPPKVVKDTEAATKKVAYYTVDIQGTIKQPSNYTKLFLGSDDITTPTDRPAATINGYRIGAKSNEKLYVKLSPAAGTDEFFNVELEPTGFVKYIAKGTILNPSGGVVNSVYADAANLIEGNRRMIQEEVFGYILEKYPRLQNISYVNPGLNPAGNRYFDARNLILANRQEIVNSAFDQMVETFGVDKIQGVANGKCKRDIGLIVDAIAEDLRDGGNSNIIDATKFYFDGAGNPINNGLVGEETQSIYAFNRARDLCKKAIANLLTVKADLYDPDPNSNLTPYGINAGYTGSAAEEAGLTTNGVTIDISQKQDPAGRYKDARNRIVANREFILDASIAEISVYHPDFFHPTDTQTNSQSRLADAFRLIRRNSSEIRDKALASIILSHPNFYIPGDQQTDDGSRYASAYRLIQNNKDHIVDTALAETTVAHPDYFFVGDQQTDARSRYADGYRLIQQNKTEIVNSSWNDTFTQYPAHGEYEAKCKRDMRIFVDAIGLDLFVGGNKYARKFIQEYFNIAGDAWISGGLQGEEAESIFAFNKARDYMKLAVANQLSITDPTVTPGPAQYNGGGLDIPNTNAGACDDVQSAIVTLTDIVTTQIAAGNLSALPAETAYIAGPGEAKCRRDIGILVDAIALDVFMRGNVYTWRFCAEFFDDANTPSFSFNSAVYNTNFGKAAEMMKKAITNQLYEKDLFRTADNAPGSSYGQLSRDFSPHGASYTASTGDLIIDIANHDLIVGDRVKIADNALTFTCGQDNHSTNHAYPRSTDPASGQYLEITAATTDSITVNVGTTAAVTFTPTNGTYDPATGDLVLTIGSHTLATGTNISIADNSLKFKCSMDDYGTVHTYPRATDPVSGEAIEITATTTDSITVNVGQSPLVQFTPTNATYSPTTGIMELTIGDHSLRGADRYTPSNAAYNPTSGIMTITIANHGFANGNVVRIDDDALTFTCGQDSNATNHSYPRSTDPVSGMWIPISNVTQNTFDVQVLRDAPSTNTTPHAFVSAAANSVTFPRDSIKLADNAVTFTCDQDGNTTNHSYPRAATATLTVTGADYDPQTGVMEITIANHGLKNNEQVKFADDSLTFTCLEDSNATQHTYPRSSDPVSDKWLKIFNVQTNTFQVQVLDDVPSTNITAHTFVSASANGLSYKKDPFQDNSIYIEEVPSTAATVTDATYNAATGVMVITSAAHGLSNGNKVKFELGSLTFSCTKDNNATTHSYPRVTDPVYDEWLTVSNKTNDTFEVNVGVAVSNAQYDHTFVSATSNGLLKQSGTIKIFVQKSPEVTYTPTTGTTYDPNTGLMVLEIGNHSLTAGTSVRLAPNSLTFSCGFGGATGAAAEKSYPRSNGNDPFYNTSIAIQSATATTITLQVLTTVPSTNTDPHTFVSATAGAVITGGDYAHTFVSALNNSVKTGGTYTHVWAGADTNAVVTGGDYPHTFVSAVPNSINFAGNTANQLTDAQPFLCSDVQSAIDNLNSIVQTVMSNGDLSTMPTEVNYGYGQGPGESKCARDIGYFIDAISVDMFCEGNRHTKEFVRQYFTNATTPLSNGLVGEEAESVTAFSTAINEMKRAIYNNLFYKDLTVTEGNANYNGSFPAVGTPSNATYDGTTGVSTITIADHGLSNGDQVKFVDRSLTFTCSMDGQVSEKTYPRVGDPNFNTAMTVSNVTQNTFDVTVGASPIVPFNVSNATYEPSTGDMVLTIGNHTLPVGTSIKLDDESLTFTCDKDNNATQHSYPRTLIDSDTIETAEYDPATGVLTCTITNHGWKNGSKVKFDDNSITFTCGLDNNATNHSYPRPSDPISGKWIPIYDVTADRFRLHIGVSSDTSAHTFVSATTNGIKKKQDRTYDTAVPITAATNDTITVNVGGVDSNKTFTPTFATYNPSNGWLELTIGTHSLDVGEGVVLKDNSITFTCDKDSNATNHSYPRSTDPASGTSIAIIAKTDTTITVNVGQSAPADQYVHTFVEASTDAVMYSPLSVHTFVSATTGAVKSGGDYSHTFVSATTDAVLKVVSSPVDRQDPAACSDVQAAVDTLGTIVTDAITAGNITGGIWNTADNTGTFIPGEAKCRRDVGIIVDSIAQDLWFGGNEYTLASTKEYFKGNQLIANGVDNEVMPAITAFKRAADLMNRAANNQYYDRDLSITLDAVGDPTIVGDIECDAHRVVLLNKEFIAEEAYQRMLAVYPSYTPQAGNTKQDCLDDVYDILRDVMWDVKYGGNSKTYDIAKIYTTNVANGATIETFIDAERDEAARVVTEAKNIAIQVLNNETVTVSSGNSLSQIKDPTTVEDWDEGELLPKCGSAVAAVDTLMGMIIQAIGTDAGVGTLTATRNTGNPVSDPIYETSVNLTAVTSNTLSFNVGASAAGDQYVHTFVSALPGAIVSGGAYDHRFVSAAVGAINVFGTGQQLTPVNATYDAASGDMVFYFGERHLLTTSNQINFDNNSLTFKCSMDGYSSNKTYPRAADPVAGQNLNITAATSTSFTVNVGQSPLVEHDVTAATYDPSTGLFVVTTSAPHGLSINTGVRVKTESLSFRCDKDQNQTVHSYPRASKANQPTAYSLGNCSDVLQTIDTLVGIVSDALYAGNLDNLPPLSNGNWDCANVRSTIENLFDIFTDAISTGSINNLPPINKGDFTINNEASKCFRDVSYIVDAVVNDLRLGGNQNSIQAGEAYYVGNSLTYIDGERTETIDAWNYVGQIATAAMRNFDVLAYNCSTTAGSAIVDVNDTRGIIIGMSVKEYDNSDPVNPAYVNGLLQDGATPVYTNIPDGAFVKRIVSNTQIELGVENSRLNDGNTVNAQLTSSTTELYFVYEKGAWADTLPSTVRVGPENTGPDVIQDTLVSPSYRECSGTADAIETLVGCITTIINSGLGTVTLQEQTVNTALLASRATVFTIDTTGLGPSNPHNFETGTPVRLVPRPRFDVTTGQYVDVDKRLVRLPNGFETNRTYYVIAPGRVTQPEDFSGTTFFDGNDQTRLMLATSKENAAAGIYIYASETDSIDQDVEIDLYQFILDDRYDLHNYTATLASATFVQTDVSHIFDKPSASTTPQKCFFRASEGGELPAVATTYANNPNVAVVDSSSSNFGKINPNKEFFARYQTNKKFSIHLTHADAINNVNPISFVVTTADFQVYANKRRTPMKYDPTFTDSVTDDGKWYIQCKDNVTSATDSVKKNDIFWRINEPDYADTPRTTDMWYERLDDTREADERTYKLRMVIPKYLENARDPINGFVLKTRTDDTRRLVPQKVLLKPVTGTVYGARFENPVQAGERIGFTSEEFTSQTLNTDAAYDPYKKDQTGGGVEYRSFARFSSGVQATIQSGRYVEDALDPTIKYLELTLFDHTIDTLNFSGLSNEILTTVKITAPQGGSFVANKTKNSSLDENTASFSGNSSGNCSIHAYTNVGGDHYLIIKNIRDGVLEYSEFNNTRFTQGNVFADMLEDQDMGKSLPLKTHIRKNYPQYFYKQNGANVYTITPGDRIQDSAGIEYYVDSVEDTGIIDDTFYIFGYETLQKRISGQQDGIYYLTALRGNISPFPTGPGVINNFKKFKFSQPVSKLYPLNYRNDPLWFKNSGTTQAEKDYYANLIDPPQAYSAADNYIHGLVTVNDFKGSTTRELVEDLLNNPAFIFNTYTGDNQIKAQDGNATSGSEDRKIPIAGDSTVVTDQKYYVELRRPSIARAGNHTFEYLGFGPGNYSTGLPARQEVVLTPDEDFYAQSKKEDGGIVFYTGINSQGDLYIGNRRINAITGEETFIDRATLADDGDPDDVIGGLVTTFDTPVTFNQNITIVGGDGSLVNSVESPIVLNIQEGDFTQVKNSLIIRSNVSATENNVPILQGGIPQDDRLNRTTGFTPPTAGDITISKNKVKSAVFEITPIWYPRARGYKFFTHGDNTGFGINKTPNQTNLVASGGSRIDADQFVEYGNSGQLFPSAGDFLFKGAQVNQTGSLGWIFADGFTKISDTTIDQLITDGSNRVKITWSGAINSALNITSGSQIRFIDYVQSGSDVINPAFINGTWSIVSPDGDAFSVNNNYVHIQLVDPIGAGIRSWSDVLSGSGSSNPQILFSQQVWKEVGVLGAEAIRTETSTIGDYKLGINTITRAAHDALDNAWTSGDTDPRANLDVVGNAFISGTTTDDFLDHTNFADRNKTAMDDAFIVGGDSDSPSAYATFRVATTNGGRVGINCNNSELTRDLCVQGTSYFTGDAKFIEDIEVNGSGGVVAEVRTSQTTGTVRLFDDSTFVGGDNTAGMNFAGWAKTIKIGSGTTANQWIYIGDSSTGDSIIKVGNSADHSNLFLGDIGDDASYISKVQIGGAYGNNSSNSYTLIGTRQTSLAGDLLIGANKTIGGDETDPTQVVTVRTEAGVLNFFTTQTQTVNFATNASLITIGGQGGSTTIRNNFIVDANARFNADIKLCGGNASYSFVGDRAQLGTDDFAHASGELGNNTFNSNIDIINVAVIPVADPNSPTTAEVSDGFNRVDTAGAGVWGGTNFQESKTGAGAEGADLPAITGDEFYLPMKYAPTPYFQAGDYLLIDTIPTGSGATERYPELVRITEDGLSGAGAAPFYLKVRRHPLGSFTKYKLNLVGKEYLDNHQDATDVWKCNLAFDATWTTQPVDATGPQDNFYLSQFGGGLTTDDYVIVDREDTNNDGDFNQGEIVKVVTPLDQVSKKLVVTRGCDTGNETDVFVVDSVTGDIIMGDPSDEDSILNIYGSLKLEGGCGTTPIVNNIFDELEDTADDAKLTLANRNFTTFEVNTCMGDTVIGNPWGWVWALQGNWSTTPAAHLTTDNVFVYTYEVTTVQADGPQTTLGSVLSAGQQNYMVVNKISAFQKGDMLLVYQGSTKAEIITITDNPFTDVNTSEKRVPFNPNTDYSSGGRAQETTTAQQFDIGAVVVKITRDSRTTNLLEDIPATGRTVAPSPNNNPDRVVLKLANGDLVAQKLDYEQFIRIGNEFFLPDSIDGSTDQAFGVKMPKSIRDAYDVNEPEASIRRYFGGGRLRTHDDINMTSGNLRMFGTDGKTLIFNVANDDGHPGDGAILDPLTGKSGMYLNGRADIFGQLRVFNQSCQENGICSNELQFRVQNEDGSVEMGASLYIKGQISAIADTSSEVIHIDNLGAAGNTGAGPKDFIMYQDGSIDAFGINRYYNSNGGRRWTYVPASTTGLGQTVDNPLQPNGNYLINPSSNGNMIVYLPDDAQTGDMIRFIDISGNLSYNASFIIRAKPLGTTAVPIQGDVTGTKATAGSGAPSTLAWASGEMIVQTRNASFGLVYVGVSDAVGDPNASEIPTDLRGWWLQEL